jgi:hypothetical protein
MVHTAREKVGRKFEFDREKIMGPFLQANQYDFFENPKYQFLFAYYLSTPETWPSWRITTYFSLSLSYGRYESFIRFIFDYNKEFVGVHIRIQ